MPTLFEQMVVIINAMREEMELAPLEMDIQPKVKLPDWGKNIVKRFGKTIFKPTLKLRPSKKVVWRNYGKCIGIIERGKAFWEHDAPRLLELAFADVTEEQAEKLVAKLGVDQIRAYCIKALNRPVSDEETLEDLVEEIWDRYVAHIDRLRKTALTHVAQQSPKNASQFFKGMAEGYTLFIDEDAAFCGDRGRTHIYVALLGCMLEVEKLRETLPPTTRRSFYDSLAEPLNLPRKAYDWFNDVCDDIKFPLNNLGRPRRYSFL